ncbi:MAG: metallophosphoesterase [Elusimicrobiota bacterium]|nr:metallophosphoesterase [Elusimicrobiota bacterium]
MKTYHFLPVLLLLLASYIGLHFYSARWLTRSFSLGQAAAYWLRLALLTVAFLSPLALFLKRYQHGPLLEVLYAGGYAWMGIILIAAFVFAASDLAAFALQRAPWFQPRLLSGAALALLAVITAWGVYGGQKIPEIKEISAAFKGLPPELEGFKIAQISDMHVDSDWKLRQYSGIVDRINSAGPDLVLVTGDLLDPGITCQEKLGELTSKIKSRLGLFGSLGNHEYYYGLDRSLDCYKAFGIKLLKNEAQEFKSLRLIGLGDIHTEKLSEQDVAAILKKAGNEKFTILMSHQPVYYRTIAETGDYLVLSGHTHKGQLFPFHIFTKLFYRYFYGLYRIKNSVFYVTSGSGTWGPPLRWLAPAEIPVITLTSAK